MEWRSIALVGRSRSAGGSIRKLEVMEEYLGVRLRVVNLRIVFCPTAETYTELAGWCHQKSPELSTQFLLLRRVLGRKAVRTCSGQNPYASLGIGKRLVTECGRFAQQAGYRKIVLWTNNVLATARRLYEKAGFCLIYEEPHQIFGVNLIGETWELKL